MAIFKIIGGQKLNGEFTPTGAKNAALKMIAASVMIPGKTLLKNVPRILDISEMINVIESIGAKIKFEGDILEIDSSAVNSFYPSSEFINKLRGSVVIIGPLLAKFGQAKFSEPGGCLIGSRPIDTHLKAFFDLDVHIDRDEKNQNYILDGRKNFSGKNKVVILDEMSVTATENVLMAAVLRKGITTIKIAACEPEIVDLANFLNNSGAKITGAGTHTIIIEGVKKLHPSEHTIIPDRIEIGTIMIAAAICGGKVVIKNAIPDHLELVFNKFRHARVDFGVKYNEDRADIYIEQKEKLQATNIDTRPYPGFPTDLQSPFAILATQAKGKSKIFETLFSSRFDYIKSLLKMAASIEIESPHIVNITGPTDLNGEKIICSDLRGGAALVLAAMVARGKTEIEDIRYIDRGYENFDQRLNQLGAKIERI